jgi:hypothetical protein
MTDTIDDVAPTSGAGAELVCEPAAMGGSVVRRPLGRTTHQQEICTRWFEPISEPPQSSRAMPASLSHPGLGLRSGTCGQSISPRRAKRSSAGATVRPGERDAIGPK